ncbi:hypothetical protein LX32DRAFT_645634 [Colletotrichum zoysiae]|uniref:2EXR domain-containing protein n=1 Tax=Colletotrichum zoysiae TaxID=1216348 RepID=A0AAD9H4G6_9PEZI|nr:hypothetical protein LX32DRAFT_645634 [Colletotrichum zoysiae]
MAAEDFRLFSLLPGELRDQIWDHSVRPQGIRGVQYFSIFPYDDIPEAFSRHLIPPAKIFQLELFGPPRPEDAESLPSWNLNRSTYSIDGGLWTACKESRAAMHRRYKPERWSQFYDSQRSNSHQESLWRSHPIITGGGRFADMPATFLVNSDKGHQYFTLLPAKDLIYIQGMPSSLDGLENLYEYMPFSSPSYGFGGIRHLAIELDPLCTIEELSQYERSWYDGSDNDIPECRRQFYDQLVMVVRDERGDFAGVTVWLVDPRLRSRNTEISAASQNSVKKTSERIVFKANGCKYHEVPRGILQDNLPYYDAETEDQPDFSSVWDFAFELEEAAARIHAIEERIEDYEVWGMHEFKFLVCEKDE